MIKISTKQTRETENMIKTFSTKGSVTQKQRVFERELNLVIKKKLFVSSRYQILCIILIALFCIVHMFCRGLL